MHLSHRFTSAQAPQKSFNCHLSHFHTSVVTSLSSAKCLPPRCFFSGPNRRKSVGPSLGCKAEVQVPTIVLEFYPGLLELYGFWHCYDEEVPLLPAGLDIFWELHPEASTELHSTMQNSCSPQASESGANSTPWESQNPVSITFPADGITLNILAESELSYFHCIEGCDKHFPP
jgi:hypothetical protein